MVPHLLFIYFFVYFFPFVFFWLVGKCCLFLNNLFYIPDFLLPNMCIDIPDVRFLIFYNAVYISDMYNGYTCECLLSKTTIYYSYFMFHFDQSLLVEHSVHDVLPSSIAISTCKYVYFILSIFCLSYSTHKFYGHHFSINANLHTWNHIKKVILR